MQHGPVRKPGGFVRGNICIDIPGADEGQPICTSKCPAQAGVEVVGGRVTAAHLGVIVDLGVEVLFDSQGDAGPYHRKVPFDRISLEGKDAPPLAEVGLAPPLRL